MKFIHTADIHLGMKPDSGFPWSELRGRELRETFERLIKQAASEKPELLFIAGDLFHSKPSVRSLKEVNALLAGTPETQVILIAGNHDHAGADSPYRSFEWAENVHFLGINGVESVYFPEIDTEVYGHSFTTRKINEEQLQGLKPKDAGRINILVAHGGEAGSLPMNFNELAENFDYVALGHIHCPKTYERLKKEQARVLYSGCPEPTDRNETGACGYIKGELKKTGNSTEKALLHAEFVDFSKRRYVRAIIDSNPSMTDVLMRSALKNYINENGAENIYTVIIRGKRDPDIIYDTERFSDCGMIIEAIDESVPDYDFDAIYAANADNLVGMYIKKVRESGAAPNIIEKALYFGLDALLGK